MTGRHEQRARAIAQPEPGYFAIRLVRKGPKVPARIHHENGLWWADVNGETFTAAADPAAAPRVFTVWHSGDFISRAEYRHLLALKSWARRHQPDHPAANPDRPIDLTKMRSIF